VNGDGYISSNEMATLLGSVFKVIYKAEPHKAAQIGANADELAKLTTEQCFDEADLNSDGKLSFEEFYKWFCAPGRVSAASNVVAHAASAGVISAPSQDRYQDMSSALLPSLDDVRELLKLTVFDVTEVLDVFAENSRSGWISQDSFNQSFANLVELGGGHADRASAARARDIVGQLYQAFDLNGDGVVDFNELASGISVLCSGSRSDKVRAAFELFDTNRDGVISLQEMARYLKSVYRILYAVSQRTRRLMGDVSADELGMITAKQCFSDVDTNKDGVVSFSEFERWYTQAEL